jgi:hypothetical protein
MNERIREFEKQCWNHQANCLDVAKFAELIVRECADIGHLYEGGEYEVRNQIMAHFGVEE